MKRFWIDLDNAPHVPFFRPIGSELEARGHSVDITIRDYGYTAGLADRAGLAYTVIGAHPGVNPARKVCSLALRAARLAFWAASRRFDAGISHGSRGLVLGSALARVPVVTMFDYEHVSSGLFRRLSKLLLLPSALDGVVVGDLVVHYAGYKEEVYLGDFEHDTDIVSQLDLPDGKVIILIRPPATTAHYHDTRSEQIFDALLDRVGASNEAFGLIVPRTVEQGREIRKNLKNLLNFHILERPLGGLNLIWQADLVVGGGGTMNREAALLGVPVYSIFTGPVGAIDQQLSNEGRLHLIRKPEDVTGIKVKKRLRDGNEHALRGLRSRSACLVSDICDFIVDMVDSGKPQTTRQARTPS